VKDKENRVIWINLFEYCDKLYCLKVIK